MSEKKIIIGTRQFNHLIDESVKKLSNWKYKNNFNAYLKEYYMMIHLSLIVFQLI